MRCAFVSRLFLLALPVAGLLAATACEGRAQLFGVPVNLPDLREPVAVVMADPRGTGRNVCDPGDWARTGIRWSDNLGGGVAKRFW